FGAQHQASIVGWECGVHEALTVLPGLGFEGLGIGTQCWLHKIKTNCLLDAKATFNPELL
ncbi:hypothetical protein, partial [Pseudomonas syringae]